jgi:hypothetical protein
MKSSWRLNSDMTCNVFHPSPATGRIYNSGEILASCTSCGEQTSPLAEVTIAVAATLLKHSENKTSQKGSQIVLRRLSKMTEKTLRARFSALKDLFEKPPHSVTKHQANPRQLGLNRTGRKLRIVENSYRSASSRIAARFTGTLSPRSILGGRTSQRLADTIRQQPWAAFVSDNGENLLQTAFSTHAQQ